MSDTMGNNALFLTLVRTPSEGARARMLVDSIRSFGGDLSRCKLWLFEADAARASRTRYEGSGIRVLPLNVPDRLRRYLFSDKVYACARAEEMVDKRIQSLIWIDPGCLIIRPPTLFHLGRSFDAAIRPVHIRNVGLSTTEPVDGFWKKVYEVVGVKDVRSAVDSFVDGQHIRAYYNSHAFSVNPSVGLLRRWTKCFRSLVLDQAYQARYCHDELHQIFLHQAVLSALLATSVEPARIRILPPSYSYPYNLHQSVPSEHRAPMLNDLVSVTYEDRSLDPAVVDDIGIREPLRSWLCDRKMPYDSMTEP
jgi:hypothetical protein